MEGTQGTGLNQICVAMCIWHFGAQVDKWSCEKHDEVDTKSKTDDNGVKSNSLHPFFCLRLSSESTDCNMEYQPMHMLVRKGNTYCLSYIFSLIMWVVLIKIILVNTY